MRPVMAKAEAMIVSGDGYLDFGFKPDYVKVFQKPDSSGSLNASSEYFVEGIPDSESGSGNGNMIHQLTDSTGTLSGGVGLSQNKLQLHSMSWFKSNASSSSNDTAFAGVKIVGSNMSASIGSTAGWLAFGFRND